MSGPEHVLVAPPVPSGRRFDPRGTHELADEADEASAGSSSLRRALGVRRLDDAGLVAELRAQKGGSPQAALLELVGLLGPERARGLAAAAFGAVPHVPSPRIPAPRVAERP